MLKNVFCFLVTLRSFKETGPRILTYLIKGLNVWRMQPVGGCQLTVFVALKQAVENAVDNLVDKT